MKRVSLTDLSKSLNISKTTISFVLNGRAKEKGVSAETERRVLKKVKELNYIPNNFARGLRTGKSMTIGIVVADISNPFYARICRNIENEFDKNGYNVLFSSTYENPDKEKHIINVMVERGVDGIILSPTRPYSSRVKKELTQLEIPLVFIDRHYPNSDIPYVVANNYQSSFEATKKLIEFGHKHIAFIAIKPTNTSVMADRIRGYKDALKAANIPFRKKFYAEFDLEDLSKPIYHKLDCLNLREHSATAILSGNNKITLALIECFQRNKILIPNDVSLISFDYLDVFSILTPPISSIQIHPEEIGDKAAKLLLSLISSPQKFQENLVIEPVIHIKESVKYILDK
ncbi:MAG: LacI family DNA-binding transcriptional regulator [Bacteroidales bacterium]|nr:LacI family DNA-binding transcriptional regulator [Bacteroidales bacterium]